jgi:basic membrane protein A
MAVGMGVAACGGDDEEEAGGGAAGEKEPIKVGSMLFGPKNDKSFNQAAYEGMLAARKQFPQIELTSVLENRNTVQNGTDGVETLAPINDVVIGVSEHFGPIFDATAPKFSDAYFINSAGYSRKLHKNVTGYAVDWGASAFIGGAVAATLTKSNIVGYVGGAEIPPTVQALEGFRAGVRMVDSDIKVLRNIVGDFNDAAKAKAATAAMLTDGADVIFPFLDAGIEGSYEAGRESGKDPPMFKLVAPDCEAYENMVGTQFVNNAAATERMLTDYVNGKLEPGAIFLSLQDPDMQTLQLCPKYQENEDVAEVTKKTIDGVNSGDIKLPQAALNPRPDYPYREGFEGETIEPGGGG